MKRHISVLVAMSVLVISGELILSYYGPLARLARTPVILAPLYNSTGMDEGLVQEIRRIIESHLVQTGSFSIIKQSRWEDYFHKNPEKKKGIQPYRDYIEIAREIEVEKLMVVNLYGSEAYGFTLYLSLRDCNADLLMKSLSLKFKSSTELNDSDEIIRAFSSISKRLSLYDYFFILLLVFQAVLTVLTALNRPPFTLQETVLVMTTVLFLFSFFYARNANMDYFQRFVATRGQVTIARDSKTEQLYALIRYGPLFLLNLIPYLSRLRHKHKSKNLALSSLSALLYYLSFPNVLSIRGIFPLGFIALVPLFIVLVGSGFPKGVFYGTVFGVLQAILINFWQGTYSYIGLALVTLGLLIQYSLFMVVLTLLLTGRGRRGFYLIPPVWVIFEYLRSVGFLAFPWGLIGTSQFPFTSFIQMASLTGIWGISLAVLYVNAAIADLVVNRYIFNAAAGKQRNKILQPPAFVLTATLLIILGGTLRLGVITRRESLAENHFHVVVIQQNRDPRKHNFSESLDFAVELTRKAITDSGRTPDLILWPEGAFKPDIHMYQDAEKRNSTRGKLLTRLEEFVREIQSPLATGTQDHIFISEWDEEKGEETKVRRNFNSSALLDSEGRLKAVYHKIHLVPFTEHFPYKKQFPFMWEFLQKYDTSNWLAGTERKVLDTGSIRFMTPICFEDVFPDHIRRFVLKDCDLIANMSNDYWSLSPIEGMQHGINGLFRAVENGKPMVRSTTSGYTVYADPAGRIINDVKQFFEKGVFTAVIPDIDRPLTLYSRWGDWLPRLLIMIIAVESLLFYLLIPIRKRMRRRWIL